MRSDILLLLIGTHLLAFSVGMVGTGSDPYLLEDTVSTPRDASARIVSVTANGGGTVGAVSVSIVPGDGRVLLDTNPFVETDTQASAKTAAAVAEQVTGVSLANRNVVYRFTSAGDYLGGPSAGAGMTVATIAAIQNRSVRDDVAITGTVWPDGRIGQVGNVAEKAATAGDAGLSTFLVPDGQETFTYYEPVDTPPRTGGIEFEDVQYEPRTVRLNNMTTTEYGMETRDISTVRQAVAMMLQDP